MVLHSCSLAVVAVAGCASTPSTETTTERTDVETSAGAGGTRTDTLSTGGGSGGTATTDLDLREANVVGVEFEGGDGTYDFSVTLYHDDDGEEGYANWWQVESLDGDCLARRTLLHAHSTEPFTRSATVDVPGGTTCVVVRGHDQTHEYGGQAMVVNLDTGATRRVSQGTDRRSVDRSECP